MDQSGSKYTTTAGPSMADLPSLLTLDEIAPNRFRNRGNQSNMFQAIFGGSTIAQALAAADRTVDGRASHSMHAYFLRSGNANLPVDFDVERVRDGGRLSTRRVTASQNGVVILTAECSFRVPLQGFSHQRPSENKFDPDNALDPLQLGYTEQDPQWAHLEVFRRRFPVEVRIPSEKGYLQKSEPKRHYWLRAPSAAGVDDPATHRQMLAFLSDYMFSGVPLSPHGIALPGPHMFVASVDHALWFHRPLRCDDWLLFETDSPNAEGALNLSRGLVYNRAGDLVASMAQEALQYLVPPKA